MLPFQKSLFEPQHQLRPTYLREVAGHRHPKLRAGPKTVEDNCSTILRPLHHQKANPTQLTFMLPLQSFEPGTTEITAAAECELVRKRDMTAASVHFMVPGF